MGNELLERQRLDLDSRHPFIHVVKDFGKSARVEARRAYYFRGVVTPVDEGGVAVLLQVEKSCGALDVCEACRVLVLENIEPFTPDKDELQVSAEFLVVLLEATKEISDFAVEIIQNFDLGWLFAEEHLTAAQEYLGIG